MRLNPRIILTTSIWLIILLVIAYICFYYVSMRHTKEPKFALISKSGPIEVRQYDPMIMAQVSVSGERDKAINTGFRMLADYIFGDNTTQNQESTNIRMTAPVIQQSKHQKIAMTSPVLEQAAKAGDKNQWFVRFVLPDNFTLQDIPQPINPKVTLHEVPAHKMIVIRFSGRMTESNLAANLKILNQYIAKHNFEVSGAPIYAFYNPPWTLPFMRRNEIMYTVNHK